MTPAKRRSKKKASSDLETVSWWDDFYRVVRLIPPGRVSTYGAVALFGGHPRAARHVGYAMAALKDTGANADVPWQRVLGAAPREKARVTIKDPVGGAVQRAMLEAEGVTFDGLGRVDLSRYGWSGPRAPAKRAAAKKRAVTKKKAAPKKKAAGSPAKRRKR